MRKLCVTGFIAGLVAACGGGGESDSPRLIAGGGVSSGSIDGKLNVYVIDDLSFAPLAGAQVRVGASASTAPLTGTTDSTGLVVFENESLDGAQVITASMANYSAATWIGANGQNVTIPLTAKTPTVDTAVVNGTIAGFDALPAPAANHRTIGVVGYSAPENRLFDAQIPQGKRTLSGTPYEVDANQCVTVATFTDCNFRLTTRTGVQAHFAIILDQDTNGTPAIALDDTFTITGFAIKRDLNFTAGQQVSGEMLTLIPDADTTTMTVSFGTPPSGLDASQSLPILNLGAEGNVLIGGLDQNRTTAKVPKLVGPLANARYDVIMRSVDGVLDDYPGTASFLHNVNIQTTVTATTWQAAPSALAVNSGTYSFTQVAGASVHGVDFLAPPATLGGREVKLWGVVLLDGSTSFTLPALTPDPLGTGMVLFRVNAVTVPGWKLDDFALEGLFGELTALSNDQITFTH